MATESNGSHRAGSLPDEPPPILGTWRRFYVLVIVNTLFVYLMLLLFSYYARR